MSWILQLHPNRLLEIQKLQKFPYSFWLDFSQTRRSSKRRDATMPGPETGGGRGGQAGSGRRPGSESALRETSGVPGRKTVATRAQPKHGVFGKKDMIWSQKHKMLIHSRYFRLSVFWLFDISLFFVASCSVPWCLVGPLDRYETKPMCSMITLFSNWNFWKK